MAVTLTLYALSCETNRVDKSNYLSVMSFYSAELKEPTDVLRPVLTIAHTGQNGKIPKFNYFSIGAFDRFYFVEDIVVLSQGLIQVTGRVDVLHTYRNAIKALTTFVERNEFTYNALLNDNERPFKQVPLTTMTWLHTGGNFEFEFDLDENAVSAIVETMQAAYTSITERSAYYEYAPLTPATIPGSGILDDVNTANLSRAGKNGIHYGFTKKQLDRLGEHILDSNDFDAYFLSVVNFPFDFSSISGYMDSQATKPYLYNDFLFLWKPQSTGDDAFINNSAYPDNHVYRYKYGGVIPYLKLFSQVIIPSITDYKQLPPFTYYQLFIPFVGWVDLQPQIIAGHTCTLYYSLSSYDGSGIAFLVDESTQVVVADYPVNVGTRIDFTKANLKELRNAMTQGALSMALNAVGSVLSASVMAESGNALGAGIALASGASSIIQGSVALAQNNYLSKPTGSINAQLSVFNPSAAWLRKVATDPLFADGTATFDSYAHEVGLPLAEPKLLSSLSGFTRCSRVNIDDAISVAYASEKEEIQALLISGVIL